MTEGRKGKTKKKKAAGKGRAKAATAKRVAGAESKPVRRRTSQAKPSPPAEPGIAAAEEAAAQAPPPETAPAATAWEAAAASGEAVAAPEAKDEGGLKPALVVAAVVAILGGAGYVSWPLWSDAVAPYVPGLDAADDKAPEKAAQPAPESAARPAAENESLEEMKSERARLREELTRLIDRMETLEKALESVKKMVHATAPPSERTDAAQSLDRLSERLKQLEKNDQLERNDSTIKALVQRLDQLEKESAAKPSAARTGEAGVQGRRLSSAIADIEKRLASIEVTEGRVGGVNVGRARAVVLAVANLREAVGKGGPFENAIETLRAVAGDDPNIKAAIVLLAKSAATGIPTLAGLRDRFDDIAGKIVVASKTLEERGWMERAANRIASLVTWRRVDEKGKSDSVDAIVARAERRLRAGDLSAAVEAVEGLSGNAKVAAVAASWLKSAKTRLAAERSIATLHIHAISLLAPLMPPKE